MGVRSWGGLLLIGLGALVRSGGPPPADGAAQDEPAQLDELVVGSEEDALLKEEARARWGDIGLALGGTAIVGLFGSVLLATLSSPPSRDVVSAWWELPTLELPDLPWVEITLAAVGLPTTLVIAVAVGPQTPDRDSGRPVPVSEVVRADVVGILATGMASLAAVLLWVFVAFVPRTAGGLVQGLLLALAAVYCACLAGLGGPSHRQRLRNVEELRRLQQVSTWVDDVTRPSWARAAASSAILSALPGIAVTVVLLGRLQMLKGLGQWWSLALALGATTTFVTGLVWLSWSVWMASWISREGYHRLSRLQEVSPFRVLHVTLVPLWLMAGVPGLVLLSRRSEPMLLDIGIAILISIVPLLGLWLLRRTGWAAATLARAALHERRRLVRQATSSARRVERVRDP